MRKSLFTTSFLAIAAASVPAGAQEPAMPGETVLSTIVVTTPLRRESSLAGATGSVTVIDRAAIEKAPTNDVAQLLKSYAGVSVTSYGGLGSSSGVQLRGMSSTQTLVLVNGVRTASATAGSTAWANIPLESIERIEIAKGPHSAAYGADAIGGVINIITRRGDTVCHDGKLICGSITAGVSHPWGGFTSADVRGEKDDFTFALGANLIGTRGYDFTLPAYWGHEPDDDGFLRGSMNFALARKFGWGEIHADGLVSRGRGQADSSGSNEADSLAFSGKAGVRVDHADDWFTTLEASQGIDWSKNFRNGVAGSQTYETRRTGILARTEKTFATGNFSHVFMLGGEFYRENVDTSPSSYAVTQRDLSAAFGQYSLENGPWQFDGGLRYDYNEQFGDAWTYSLGGAYDVTSDLKLRASWGTGFRAPNFNDLYYPLDSWGYSGNPDLRPEHSKTFEVGLAWSAGPDTTLEISAYRTWLKDGIVWGLMPDNVDRARVTGFEATVNQNLNDRFSVNAGIDIQDPRNETTGEYLQGRDRFKARLGFDLAATEALSLTVTGFYGGGSYDMDYSAGKIVRLDDYFTMDATANYKLDEQSSLKLSAVNLFDAEYSTVKDYRAPGRTVTLSFTRRF